VSAGREDRRSLALAKLNTDPVPVPECEHPRPALSEWQARRVRALLPAWKMAQAYRAMQPATMAQVYLAMPDDGRPRPLVRPLVLPKVEPPAGASRVELGAETVERLAEIFHQGDAPDVSWHEPIPTRLVDLVLRLRVEDRMTWDAMVTALAGQLSHRKVHYIRDSLKHGDLTWDDGGTDLGPLTRNTTNGIVLPGR
jgi:hypothetical protein